MHSGHAQRTRSTDWWSWWRTCWLSWWQTVWQTHWAVRRDNRVVDELIARIERLASARARVIVGIAGKPGAGKSSLALALVRRLAGAEDWRGTRAAYLPMDGFHLADAELARLGRRERKGAPDTFDAAGYAALLARVAAGESVWAPEFDRRLEEPVAQSLPVTDATRIVITEGNYLLLPQHPWREARTHLAECWYVQLEEQKRLRRLVARHVEFGKTPEQARDWVTRSDEANAAMVGESAFSADLMIDLDALR